MSPNILIVEDEPAIRQMLSFMLAGDGYSSVEASDVTAAKSMLDIVTPDLILLDWMLPGLSGIDFARRLKHDPKTSNIPIIILTAKGEENDKIRGIDSGVDDFVTKPFSTRELLARVRAVIRRTRTQEDNDVISAGPLQIDLNANRIQYDGRNIGLSPTEFKLLRFFVSNPERVHTRRQLVDAVWGANAYIEERTVDVHIRRLRKLLAPHGCDNFVQTVRSFGYRFSTQVA